MNKRICAMILGAMIVFPGVTFAGDSANLFKNSELKIDAGGKLTYWFVSAKYSQDTGYKDQKSVRIPISGKEGACKAVMIQDVSDLKPGKYIFSAYLKLDRKIDDIVLIRIIKLDGKDDYQGTHLNAADQPEPGVWGKVMCEFDIPEGTNSATIAFDLRDTSPGATVWVDSPSFSYKTE